MHTTGAVHVQIRVLPWRYGYFCPRHILKNHQISRESISIILKAFGYCKTASLKIGPLLCDIKQKRFYQNILQYSYYKDSPLGFSVLHGAGCEPGVFQLSAQIFDH